MPRPPRRTVLAAAEQSATPPDTLLQTQSIARVVKTEGNSFYTCELPNNGGSTVLVELEGRFRNTIWIKRGGYVLVDITPAADRTPAARIDGVIVNVVRDEKAWRKQPYWPAAFPKRTYDDDSEEESNMGKLPPSDSENEN